MSRNNAGPSRLPTSPINAQRGPVARGQPRPKTARTKGIKPLELLETERLILRELRKSDADRIYRYANEESINQYLTFGELASESGAARYVKKAMASAASDPTFERRLSYKLALLIKPEVDFIGSCWLDITDIPNKRASLGYFIDYSYWGRGYATEAARALVKYGFETLDLHRIEATCDADHQASRRVLEKAGFKREARLRQRRQRGGHWTDSILFAIIKEK